ncbi:MAG: glutamate--tRNA ligase family protein [Victivallales bacterium]
MPVCAPGEFEDGSKVLRAKIDMASPNIHMRDPVIYRIRHTSHHRSGDQWCIYPMYDFAHPLEDAIEHITHSICTLEFEKFTVRSTTGFWRAWFPRRVRSRLSLLA